MTLRTKAKQTVKNVFESLGYELIPRVAANKNFEKDFKKMYLDCREYTCTTIERMYSLYEAVKYIIDAKVPGDFVECGVWRGGSSMIMAHTLLKMGETGRKIYLYDTFAGMSKPTEKDVDIENSSKAIARWNESKEKGINKWAFSPVEEVRKNMLSTGYPENKMIFVKGKVEDTIPKTMPSKIAILRLDTDWYESTYHELKHLFPLLSKRGVLIIDDYGHWAGARQAVDEYIKEKKIKILLNSIDRDSKIGIKL